MADVTFPAFAGINNVLPPERIRALPTKTNATCELVAAVNVDIDDSGQVRRRAGQTLRAPGAAHSLWSRGDDCLFAAGGQLRRLHPDFTSTALAPLSTDAPVSYVAVNDRIYWSNGTDTGIVTGSVSRSWGMTASDSPQVTAIAGALTAGQYQAAITYIRDDGQESGAGMTSTITLTEGQGVRFAWTPPADPDVVEVALYLSEPNGMVLYEAGTAPVGPGTADALDPALSLPLNSQWCDKPPAGSHLAYHNGRIYIAEGAFIFGTTALGFEHCDLRDYLGLDNTPIGFLVGVAGGLYIGTEKAVYFAAGDRLEQFTRKTVTESPCVPGSAVLAEGFAASGRAELSGRQVVLFATKDGVYMGMEDGSVSSLTQSAYAPPALPAGAALFRDASDLRQYILLPAGVVVNTHTSAVTTYTGMAANSACAFAGDTLAATAAGIVALTGDTDLGAPIAASITSGVTDFSESAVKRVVTGLAGYRADGDVELTLIADGHHESVYRLLPRRLDDQHAARVKFGRGTKGRYWQWRLSNRAGADFAIDTLTLDAQALSRRLA